MRNFREKIVVAFLLVLMVLPLYVWMVNVVNALEGHELIESFELRSGRKSVVADVFDVGDSLVVVVASGLASTYDVTVFGNSSVVFASSGVFNASEAVVTIVLSPPTFNAGEQYVLVFGVRAINYPVPGSEAMDSVASVFGVVDVDTKLQLEAEYDDSSGSLHLNASLTSVDGYPVANETVDFLLQFANTRRPTNGWVPLGSVVSDENGEAELNVAFALSDGRYSLIAEHRGNRNFGKSSKVMDMDISANITVESLASGGSGITGELLNSSSPIDGTMSLSVPTNVPYALLPLSARARFSVLPVMPPWYPDPGPLWMLFYLDYANLTGFLSGTLVWWPGVWDNQYVYEAYLQWSPDILGSHTIIASVVQAGFPAFLDIRWAVVNGTVVASSSVAVNVQRCPSNVVVDFPEALYGDVLPVTVAVSKPRPYRAEVNDLYVTSALAPHLWYNDVEYVVDEGIESVPMEFYVNDTLTSVNSTDQAGLAYFLLNFNFTSARVRVAVDDSPLLSGAVTERFLSFKRFDVYGSRTSAIGDFHFNFTVGSMGENGLYVGVESPLRGEATLFDKSVWNLPVRVISAERLSWAETDSAGEISIPSGSDYLRVAVATGNDGGGGGAGGGGDARDPGGGANPEGALEDLLETADSSSIGSCEIMYDSYYSPADVSLNFDSGETVHPDSRGFAVIPSGATRVTVRQGVNGGVPVSRALVDFNSMVLNRTLRTNDLGVFWHSLVYREVGKRVLRVWLPSSFSVSLVANTTVSSSYILTNFVGYFDVVKRPIELSVSYEPAEPVPNVPVTSVAHVFDAGLRIPAEGVQVGFSVYDMVGSLVFTGSSFVNSSGVAAFSWAPTSNIVYDVVADYYGNATYDGASAALRLDLRTPTNLRLWLGERATVIFSSEPSLDGYMYMRDSSYPPFTSLYGPFTIDTSLTVGQYKHTTYSGGTQFTIYEIFRSYVSFDTSSLPDDAQVYSALLKFKCQSDETSGSDFLINVVGGLQPIYGSSLDAADWSVGSALVGQWDTLNFAAGYISIGVDASQVNVAGRTQFVLKTNREGIKPDGIEIAEFYSGDGAGSEPYLEVAYYYPAQEIEDGGTINVGTFVEKRFFVEGLPVSGGDERVDVYVDGSLNKTQVTRAGDTVFNWTAESPGAYFFNVSYAGNQNNKPDDLNFLAMVQASPVSLNFTVSRTMFEPGGTVNLWSRAINPLTGQPLNGVSIGFWQDGYGYGTLIGGQYHYTDGNGVATASWTYPNDGYAHTVVAKIREGQALANVTLTIRPVSLTVGVETKLWLWIERGSTSTEHTIDARLVRARNAAAIPNQTVELDVGGTVYSLTTNATGHVKKAVNLETIGGQQTTYQVKAWFDATNPRAGNLTIQDPYGDDYLVCTTIQYDYISSQNSATLTVELPKTDSTAQVGEEPPTQSPEGTTVTIPPPKTPEQMQQEAGVHVWGEPVGIFPPWYKINIKFSIAALSLVFHSWIGIIGFGLQEVIGFENILTIAFSVPPELLNIVQSATINGITTAAATFAAGAAGTMFSRASPWYFIILTSYIVGMSLAMMGIYALADRYTARSTLFGMGFAFVGFTLGLFALDWLTNWHRSMLTSYLTGSSPQLAAMKATVNFFMSTAIKAALVIGLGLLILDTPFFAASLALGIFALMLALSIPV